MIKDELNETIKEGLDSLIEYLKSNIFYFTPEEIEDCCFYIEELYLKEKFYSLTPFITYLFYNMGNYHLSYYYSSMNEAKIELEPIRILYRILSLSRLGYEKLIYNELNKLEFNIDLILKDDTLPKFDRLLLCFICKFNFKIESSNLNNILLNELIDIQYKLIFSNLRTNKMKEKLQFIFDNINDVMIKTKIQILISEYFDKSYYEQIPIAFLKKHLNSNTFNDYLKESDYPIKYSWFYPPDINNSLYKDFHSDEYSIFSFSNEIGYSMHAFCTKDYIVIVDCGAKILNDEINYIDYELFFKTNNLDKNKVLAIVITHAHFDHVGGYDKFINYLGYTPKVYLSKESLDISRIVNGVYFKNYEIINSLNKIIISKGLYFTFFDNGHILGSNALVISYYGKHTLFTGDFSLHNQKYVRGFDLNSLKKRFSSIDTLVIETTYGKKDNELEYEDNILIFSKLMCRLKLHKYLIFLPAFSIGRTQELLGVLYDLNFNKISILGMSYEICKYYQENLNEQILKSSIKNNTDKSLDEILTNSNVLIASSGMLAKNTNSYNAYKLLLNSDSIDSVLIKTGYIDENSDGGLALDKWKEKDKPLYEVNLSAHASYYELLCTINSINPKNIIFVHGQGIISK